MSTQDDDNQSQGVMWAVLIGAILLAISLAIGMGLYRTSQNAAGAGTAVATTGGAASGGMAGGDGAAASAGATAGGAVGTLAPSGMPAGSSNGPTTGAAAMAAAGDVASVRIDNGVVKFYFASGSAELAAGAKEALGDVVKGVAAGQTAVISGYHDMTGDPAKNEELAKQRAFAVRDALVSLGIGEDKLDLKKPEVTTADGSNAEARRVEVSLQ